MRRNKIIATILLTGVLAGALFFYPLARAEAIDIGIDFVAKISCGLYRKTLGAAKEAAEVAALDIGSSLGIKAAKEAKETKELEKTVKGIENTFKKLLERDVADNDVVPVGDAGAHTRLDAIKEQEQKTREELREQDCEKRVATFIGSFIKRRILDVLVDRLVTKIQGGGEDGKALWVADYGGFLRDVRQAAFSDVIQEIGLSRACEPFKARLQLALEATFTAPPTFSEGISCTLDDVVKNVEGFYKDFSVGGWVGFTELIKPQNNYYGALIMAQEEAGVRAAAALQAAELEVGAGAGLLGSRRCLEWILVHDATGAVIDRQGPTKGNKKPTLPIEDTHDFHWECWESEIVTPGKAVGEAAARSLTIDIDKVINADDIGAYLGAITDAVIVRVAREAGGLKDLYKKGDESPARGKAKEEDYVPELRDQAFRGATERYAKSQVTRFSEEAREAEEKNQATEALLVAQKDFSEAETLNKQLISLLDDPDAKKPNPNQELLDCKRETKADVAQTNEVLSKAKGAAQNFKEKISRTKTLLTNVTQNTLKEALDLQIEALASKLVLQDSLGTAKSDLQECVKTLPPPNVQQ